MGYDVIGDVHGHYDKLAALLAKLGYRDRSGAYRHPEGRTAVFVGDLIDRGPQQVEVVDLVRQMQEAGTGLTVMGNHELNAIGYATPTEDGKDWLRKHSVKNDAQHAAFLRQVGWDSTLHRELVGWFRTLPVSLDLGGLRVCHAWWDDERIAAARRASDAAGRLSEEFLRASFCADHEACDVLEGVTKGLELDLPDGCAFIDHSGERRSEVRVRWWDDGVSTYRDAALVPEEQRHQLPLEILPPGMPPGNPSPVPVFVGHYWLSGNPGPQNTNTAVLDYGAGLAGPLVGYRWDGEVELDPRNFVGVGP